MREQKNILTYYVDGACSGNPGPGGFGVIRLGRCYKENCENLSLEYFYSEHNFNTTNNRMELSAILKVLSIAETDEYHYVIYSDSAYAVNLCNDWMYKWEVNGWKRAKNKPVENLDLVQKIYDLLHSRRNDIEIRKCAGHIGILENELADTLAKNDNLKFKKLIEQNKILI